MDRIGAGWVDGATMHRLVAGRVARQPKRLDWREMRDLSWVVTMSTAAPLAALALHLGVNPATTLGLTGLTAVAALWMVRTLRLEYSLTVSATPLGSAFARSRTASFSARWRTAALRLVPARHRIASAPVQVMAGISARRTRSARLMRRKPGA